MNAVGKMTSFQLVMILSPTSHDYLCVNMALVTKVFKT